MSRLPDPGRSARIARVEVVRTVRFLRGNTVQMIALAAGLLVLILPGTVGGGYLAYHFGADLGGVDLPLLQYARGGLAVAWIGLAAMIAARTVGKRGRIDQEEGMLTTVPARDVVGGLLLAEYLQLVLVGALPVLAVSGGFALGAGTPVPFVAIVATVAATLAVSVLIGFLIGVWVKVAVARSPFLAEHKSALAAIAFVVYFAAIASGSFDRVVAALFATLQNAPMAWFGDALLVGTPGVAPSPVRLVGAVALAAVGVPALLAAAVESATRLWYTDPVQPSATEPSRDRRSSRESGPLDDLLAGVASRRTRIVTANAWRRTRRSPIKLLYVAYPLFFLYAPLQSAVEAGQVPRSLPALIVVYGVWAIGATTLNPLGDEGAMLPTTLLSSLRGGRFVRGNVLSGALVGVPIVVVATAVTGALSPLGVRQWVALAALSGVLAVAGAFMAAGIGTAFPRFGTVRVTRSRRTVVPSKSAFALYSVVVVVAAVSTMLAAVPPFAVLVGDLVGGVPGGVVRAASGAVAVLVIVAGPAAAYRYAVRRFDRYTLS